MAVPHAILLLAMGRAHARIHVEHDAAGRSAAMHKVDPLAGQVGKSRKVLVCSKPLGLKAANLARRSCTAHDGFAADDPAHRRIVPEALGVIDILVPAMRPNTDCRSKPTSAWRPFLPVRASASISPAITLDAFCAPQDAPRFRAYAVAGPFRCTRRIPPCRHRGSGMSVADHLISRY